MWSAIATFSFKLNDNSTCCRKIWFSFWLRWFECFVHHRFTTVIGQDQTPWLLFTTKSYWLFHQNHISYFYYNIQTARPSNWFSFSSLNLNCLFQSQAPNKTRWSKLFAVLSKNIYVISEIAFNVNWRRWKLSSCCLSKHNSFFMIDGRFKKSDFSNAVHSFHILY